MKGVYSLTGMTCDGCRAKVERTLKTHVKTVEIHRNGKEGEVILEGDKIPSEDELNRHLAKIGNYKLHQIRPPDPVMAPFENQMPSNRTFQQGFATYKPLLLIIGLITIVSFKGTTSLNGISGQIWMMNFMAGFFLVFGFFKLLDVKGFADAYATYDLLAARWQTYGYVYPFIELGLGFAFLFEVYITPALWVSLGIMAFGSLGVINALKQKRELQCACLGTALNLPMSTVTLVEDLGMAIMSVLMLLQNHAT